jgi:hypothetical protein
MTDFSQTEQAMSLEKKYLVINLRKLNKIFAGLVVVAFIGYLISANSLSVEGFVLKDYNDKFNKISQENRQLEIAATNLQSLNNLSERAATMNLVASHDIEYLNINDSAVAKR